MISPALLSEPLVVLMRPKFRRYLSRQQAYGLVTELGAAAVTVEDPEERPAVTPDPKDDYLVALALTAKVDALVSGDRDLLGLHEPDVPVLTARALIARLTASEQERGEGA